VEADDKSWPAQGGWVRKPVATGILIERNGYRLTACLELAKELRDVKVNRFGFAAF
jgi:hypothetical protein